MIKEIRAKKNVRLESHSNEYRVRRSSAYSSVTLFLILTKQNAAAPFDLSQPII